LTARRADRRVRGVSAPTNDDNSRADGSLRAKRSVSVELLGQKFTLKSDDEEEYLRDLAKFVNRKLNEIKKATGRVDTGQIALLAALDIADDLFRERERTKDVKRDVDARAQKLLCAIDEMAQAFEMSEVVTSAKAPPRVAGSTGS